ncbi:hypothetical protein Hanom_Chr13g01199111 [Helianthus anomalus]
MLKYDKYHKHNGHFFVPRNNEKQFVLTKIKYQEQKYRSVIIHYKSTSFDVLHFKQNYWLQDSENISLTMRIRYRKTQTYQYPANQSDKL